MVLPPAVAPVRVAQRSVRRLSAQQPMVVRLWARQSTGLRSLGWEQGAYRYRRRLREGPSPVEFQTAPHPAALA